VDCDDWPLAALAGLPSRRRACRPSRRRRFCTTVGGRFCHEVVGCARSSLG
jgi:hypothetical protein